MVLRTGVHGLFYGCRRFPKCTATHGAHQHSGEPLGIPGDAETRKMRNEAHAKFDELWKPAGATMLRHEAYAWLRETLGLSSDEAHIAKFSKNQCLQLIAALNCRDELRQINKPLSWNKVVERRAQKQKRKRRRPAGWVA
jgi:ssDNA-binding Zn-finger/Zn-ribbon topoisomerase 1